MRFARLSAFAFVAILVAATYLRLSQLELVEFKRDEAQIALLAADLLAGRALPLVGIGTSVPGLENGPLMVYLTAIPLAVARDAAFASGFVGLLNVVAILATARVTERFFGRVAAILGATAYALGSWAVIFSRKLWPNEAMPLFAALLALGLHEAIVVGRSRGLLLAGLGLGALLNLHPSSLVFVPFVAAALLLRPRVLLSRAALGGAAIVLLISVPFLIHEVTRGYPGLRALVGEGRGGGRLVPDALGLSLLLVGPDAYAVLAGEEAPTLRAWSLPTDGLGPVMAALLIVGVLLAGAQLVRALRRGTGWRSPALALLWLGVPVALASWRTVPLLVHYLIPLMPSLFAFVGLGLALPVRLVRRLPKLRPALVAAPALVVAWAALVQVQGFVAFTQLVRALGARTTYGAPLLYQRTAADRALLYARGRDLALVSSPGPDGADDLPPVWRFLLPPAQDLRFDDGRGLLRLTPRGALYAVAPSADPEATELLSEVGTSAGQPVPVPGLDRAYEFWRASARPDAQGSGLGALENGLALADARYPAVLHPTGETLVVADWRVGAPPGADDLSLFVHLVDDKGGGIVARDLSGVDAAALEPGDQLLNWARLTPPGPLAPGRYWLYLGAYRSDDHRHVPALDDHGAPIGDGIRVGPLKVAAPVEGAMGATLARFEQGIALESVRLPGAIPAGTKAPIELVWRAEGRPDRDLTVFVHLVDAGGRVVSQDDAQPAARTYPTSIWDAGERIVDVHQPPVPAGRYRVMVGLYDATSLQRLERVDGPGDEVEVGSVEAR